jgi:hypothetical protein
LLITQLIRYKDRKIFFFMSGSVYDGTEDQGESSQGDF